MCALSAIRFNPVLKRFYERLRARGKLEKVALVVKSTGWLAERSSARAIRAAANPREPRPRAAGRCHCKRTTN